MRLKAINGNDYDEFLDGFNGGGEYGVSRHGKIGVDNDGNIFARKGVSDTDKKLVQSMINESRDFDAGNKYIEERNRIRRSDPTYTIGENIPLSDFDILKNPRAVLGAGRGEQSSVNKEAVGKIHIPKTQIGINTNSSQGTVQKLPYVPGQNSGFQNLPNHITEKRTLAPVKYSGSVSPEDLEKAKEIARKGINWSQAMMNGLNKASQSIPDEMLKERAPSVSPESFVSTSDANKSNTAVSSKSSQKVENTPRAEFHKAPAWYSPAEDTNDQIENAARRYAKELVDKQFMKKYDAWYLPYDGIVPYESSTLKNAKDNLENAEYYHKKENELRFLIPTVIDMYLAAKGLPPLMGAYSYLNSATTSPSPGLSDFVDFVVPQITEKEMNIAKEKYENMYSKNEKYLIHNMQARKLFTQALNDEIKKIDNTFSFGYQTDDENQRFKDALIEEIMRVIHMNYDYTTEKDNMNAYME